MQSHSAKIGIESSTMAASWLNCPSVSDTTAFLMTATNCSQTPKNRQSSDLASHFTNSLMSWCNSSTCLISGSNCSGQRWLSCSVICSTWNCVSTEYAAFPLCFQNISHCSNRFRYTQKHTIECPDIMAPIQHRFYYTRSEHRTLDQCIHPEPCSSFPWHRSRTQIQWKGPCRKTDPLTFSSRPGKYRNRQC